MRNIIGSLTTSFPGGTDVNINEFLVTLSKRFKNLFVVEIVLLISAILSAILSATSGLLFEFKHYGNWEKKTPAGIFLFTVAVMFIIQAIFIVFVFFLTSAILDCQKYLERQHLNQETELMELLSRLIKSIYFELLMRVPFGPLGIFCKIKSKGVYKQLAERAGTYTVNGGQ